MVNKTIKTRIVHKHAIESNWLKAINFVPLQGELIIYDVEVDAEGNILTLPKGRTTPYTYERFKIGDGKTLVKDLPFVDDGIRDVTELPTENIDDKAFYRLLIATLVHNRYPVENSIVYCVDGLPEVGVNATDATLSAINAYYNIQDNQLYGYLDSALAPALGLSAGWYPVAPLLQVAGYDYAGVIDDINNDLNDSKIRLLLSTSIYAYKDKWILVNNELIHSGGGEESIVFNHMSNTADGDFATAFGVDTEANGKGSLAGGRATKANGDYSVVLGNGSSAEGENATAFGQGNKAIGRCTNAKGYFSKAVNDHSSASGHKTLAFDKFTRSDGYSSSANSYNGELTAEAILADWKNNKNFTAAVKQMAKADGSDVLAYGYHSVAMNHKTLAEGEASVALNKGTHAAGMNQTVVGSYNAPDKNAAFIVGNGSDDEHRNNAFVIWKDGRATIEKVPTNDMDVVNKNYVDSLLTESSGIKNVTELPSNPDDKLFYRLFTATFIHNKHLVDNSKCYCVDTLPEVGEPATDGNQSIRAYYNMSDGQVYGYLNTTLASMFGIPAGWYDAGMLLNAQGWSYAGIISDIALDPNDSAIRTLISTSVYISANGTYKEVTNDELNRRFPEVTELGHWVHTIQNREGKEPEYVAYPISFSANDSAKYQIPLRENGRIRSLLPENDYDVANKNYVDFEIQNKAYGNPEHKYHTTNIHYYSDEHNHGNASIGLHQNAEDSEQEHIPLRQRNGLMTCNVPEGASDNAVVNKGYVNSAVSQKSQVQILTWEAND